MKRLLTLLMALMMVFPLACAETTEDYAVVTVNGEDLLYSEFLSIESAYLYQYEAAGVDLTDDAIYAYLQDLALTYAVEQMLVRQDMTAQGCYEFDAETEAWFAEQGKAAYNAALQNVMDTLRAVDTTEDELMVYALAYAEALGVTEQTYVDFYRTQYAAEIYHQWLVKDQPVTDAEVLAVYEARVAASQASFESNVAAFENAVRNGTEIWYVPAGYRSVLQILLPAVGDTADEKLANVQSTVDEIETRLTNGEAFDVLIREYGQDAAFNDESFFSTGYQVHQDSIIWEDAFIAAAFSTEMAQPGCWSRPFASTLGVHILYYLNDAVAGPVPLTEDLHTALAAMLYTERYTAAQKERITELANTAEIVFH